VSLKTVISGTAGTVMVGAGAVLVWHGLAPGSAAKSLPAPAAISAPSASPQPKTPATSPAPAKGAVARAIPRTAPTRIIIPAIGVDAPVIPEGTDASGALEMPPLPAQNLAGWWDGGVAPGQNGPAVIAGHVDSVDRPLVFWKLRDLKPGDKVTVAPAGVTFTVTRITQVSKSSFPTQSVYGATRDPELRLVTCGGAFDSDTGHYLSNVIVYATETR